MKHLKLKQGLNTFNLLFIATFLVLALYSALGQQIFPYIGQYRADIETYISDKLGSDVNIHSLSGDMDILTPSIHLEGITVSSSDSQTLPSLSIAAIDAILDPQASLFNLAPVFKSVRISGLYINISNDNNNGAEKDNSALIQSVIETLLLQQHLELNNVTVEFSQESSSKRLHLDNLSMTGDGFHRLMTGNITFGNDNKIKAGLRLYSEGNPYALDTFYARGVLDLPKLDVDHWLEKIVDVSIFDEFSASSQLSIEFKEGLLNYAKLNLASRSVAIPNVKTFKNVSTELWLKQSSAGAWSVWLENASFYIDSKKWNLHGLALKLSKTQTGNRWHSFIKEADINETYELFDSLNLVPEMAEGIYSDISPSGALKNFNVIVQQDHKNPEAPAKLTLAGELKGVSTKAHNSIPALSNINGVVAAGKNNGRVQFEGQEIEIAFPDLYTNPFKISDGRGQVDWKIRDDGFQVLGHGLNLTMPGIDSLKGGFDLVLPNSDSGKTGTLELNLAVSETDVIAHPILIPKITPAPLNNWLSNALLGGKINTGQFYFYDSIGAGASDPVLELYLDAKNAELSYLEDWPNIKHINGQVFVENSDVLASFSTGGSLGGQLSSTQIIHNVSDEPYLWVGSDVSGSTQEMFSYFKATPLKAVVGDVFSKWSMDGTQTTSVGLKIPMTGDIKNLKADVLTKLSKSGLNMADVGLSVSAIDGVIRYTSTTGLTATKLDASMWGEKISAAISTEMFKQDMKVDIQFSGPMNTEHLKDWLKLSILNPISGSSLVDGNVIIDTRDDGFTGLKFSSNLKGVDIDLPDKFAKNKSDILDLAGSFELGKRQEFKLSYDNKVNLALALEQGQIAAGQVYIGETEAYVPAESGIEVSGHLANVNLNEWIDVWKGIQASPYATLSRPLESVEPLKLETKIVTSPIRLLNMSMDNFYYNNFQFEQVHTIINQANGIWKFNINAPVAKGMVTLDQGRPLDVDLEYFHWPALASSDNEPKTDPLADVDPTAFPDMRLKLGEVFIGAINFGRWQLDVEAMKTGVQFSNIDGVIKKLNVKGEVDWIKPKDQKQPQTTQARLVLTSSDVAGIQKAWRIKPAIEAGYGKIDTSLKWVGSPADPSVNTLSGDFNIHLKDGRFIDAGEAGSLSAFGLLNFSAIGRRLRLDFSDIYQSGFHFDYVKANTAIDKGVIKVIDTLEIDGPSAKFASSGTVDLNTKQLNQELSATFPITGTLPLMAIIAGFAPPVAASLFVGERLVGAEIEKFTSATYKLSGTWSEPKLELMKRFDNDIEGKQDRSFWYRMKDFFGVGEN